MWSADISSKLLLALGTIHKGRPQNFRDFGPPPQLVHIFLLSFDPLSLLTSFYQSTRPLKKNMHARQPQLHGGSPQRRSQPLILLNTSCNVRKHQRLEMLVPQLARVQDLKMPNKDILKRMSKLTRRPPLRLVRIFLLFGYPPPPSSADVLYEWSLSNQYVS